MKKILFLYMLLFLPVTVFSQNIVIQLLRSINSPEPQGSDDFFRFVSNSDAFVVVGVPAGMAVTGLITKDKELFRNACVTAVASALTAGIVNGLKYSINRDRPFVTYPDINKKSKAGSPSFPSGHTSSAFATATSISLSYPKWYVIVPSYLYAGTVAYSRMDLGVHYPSDVLAGAVIGSGCAYLTWKINQKLLLKNKHKACNCPK
ncbi:MAG: phosphatase PAP2 family protein [Bacteroidia bacterium]|nr:phosphatase PAP2 family protein [Bacteroidia bacterium]